MASDTVTVRPLEPTEDLRATGGDPPPSHAVDPLADVLRRCQVCGASHEDDGVRCPRCGEPVLLLGWAP